MSTEDDKPEQALKKPWKITAVMGLIYASLGIAEWAEPARLALNTALFAAAVGVVWLVYFLKSRKS